MPASFFIEITWEIAAFWWELVSSKEELLDVQATAASPLYCFVTWLLFSFSLFYFWPSLPDMKSHVFDSCASNRSCFTEWVDINKIWVMSLVGGVPLDYFLFFQSEKYLKRTVKQSCRGCSSNNWYWINNMLIYGQFKFFFFVLSVFKQVFVLSPCWFRYQMLPTH